MNIQREKIKRFTADHFSYNDYRSVSSFFREGANSAELKNLMKEEWDSTEMEDSHQDKLHQILIRIHHRIKREKRIHFLSSVSKIASILLIPSLITIVALSYHIFNHSAQESAWAEIYSPAGSRTQFCLPDGTKGWLNSSSSLKYPVNFEDNRNVEISGEVWLDVVHIPQKDFRVITPYFDVKVLGTCFDVISYEKEETAQVILEKGKVVVTDKNKNVISTLCPDQQIIYDKESKVVRKLNIDAPSYTSWTEGILILKNEPMSEIAQRLGRKYNADIILHGDSLKSSVFRATFQDESLEEICKLLAGVAPIRYVVQKREKQPDGTFERGRVDMWIK